MFSIYIYIYIYIHIYIAEYICKFLQKVKNSKRRELSLHLHLYSTVTIYYMPSFINELNNNNCNNNNSALSVFVSFSLFAYYNIHIHYITWCISLQTLLHHNSYNFQKYQWYIQNANDSPKCPIFWRHIPSGPSFFDVEIQIYPKNVHS